MCIAKLLGFGGSKPQQQQAAPQPLAPPNASADAVVDDPVNEAAAKRKGRSSLRIDMTGPKVTGGSGLNIPQG
jgi:hypothetical protein